VEALRGTVLQCGRFGCVVRLADGRFAMLPAEDEHFASVRRAAAGGRQPALMFLVAAGEGNRIRLALADASASAGAAESAEEPSRTSEPALPTTSLDEKIINYLRQTAEWDPGAGTVEAMKSARAPQPDRLLPFEARDRRQFRDAPDKPRRRKR